MANYHICRTDARCSNVNSGLRSSATTSRALRRAETVHILDGSGSWQQVTALLDTGNEHLTCVDESFANSLGLYDSAALPAATTTLHGIVPGAKAEAPVIHVSLRIADFEFGPMRVALTKLDDARPVLVGMDLLSELFAAGLHISC